MFLCILVSYLALASGKTDENYKDQSCIDPRTMTKHPAYSEWADAYSCSRHRCQPGGRNLAIYTVGCKRVEAPESAIECEEVVEDTNMQFPYCCIRLRCLVVVRGEVWTRVLGQPWENLPAAPWSHMYKMKKPPPGDETFLPKHAEQGPVYELQTDATEDHDKTMRSSKSKSYKDPDTIKSSGPAPDIVIALTTGNDEKDVKKIESLRPSEMKLKTVDTPGDADMLRELEVEEAPVSEKVDIEHVLEASDEKFDANSFAGITKAPHNGPNSWAQIPQNQWSEHEPPADSENTPAPEEKPESSGLQALVDAIGNRMRDIENVVQRMSKREDVLKTPDTTVDNFQEKEKTKKSMSDSDYYKRFVKNHGSKYLRAMDVITEHPLYIEDTSLRGYFSDASNSVIRRANSEKEPALLTYMAPVENRRNSHAPDSSVEKKHKKRSHKKKKGKSKGRKKHHGKEDTKKRFNILSSQESDKNYISFEDSGAHIL